VSEQLQLFFDHSSNPRLYLLGRTLGVDPADAVRMKVEQLPVSFAYAAVESLVLRFQAIRHRRQPSGADRVVEV
jgi:hypothetical protein